MNDERCQIGKCKEMSELIYYQRNVCLKHWEMHCNEKSKFHLKEALAIKEVKNEEPTPKTD